MTKFLKLIITGTMVLGASSAMALDGELGIQGESPGSIGTECYIYNADKSLVDGVVLDAYNEPFIDEGGTRKNLAVIKCALPKPPKNPRHEEPTSTEDQILWNYSNTDAMCLSPKMIIEKIDEVKDEEGNTVTEEEDAVLTNYQLTEDWQNIVSASGEVSLVCKHITPAEDTEPPVLTLLAFCNDINYTIDKDRQYNIPDYLDPGATAQDDLDGDITAQIIVTGGPVDVSIVKDYTLTYSITDSSSNTVTATRVIRVVESTIKVTGQTTSYTTSGGVLVDDCNLKDDGFYQSGIATDFSRDGDTVTDNVTGLIWEDGTNVAKYTPDPYTYCDNLDLGGITDWRVPEVWELLTIVDKRWYDSAIDTAVFNNVFKLNGGYTWTNTEVPYRADHTNDQWIVNFTWGLDVSDGDADGTSFGVRCVKGTALPASGQGYTKDPNTKIVSNTTTGLEWVDHDSTGGATETWKEAIDSCENLTTGGYSDWRLPNINEYYSIFDYTENEISAPFVLLESYYIWSSTSSATEADHAWVMKQTNGESAPKLKSDSKNFMCVRNQ